MPNYAPSAKSLIYGLSDFWTLYFKDLPTIEAIYRGMEVDAGQSYLDLLTLFLNTSLQDTALFNKEYFKLLRAREDGLVYSANGRYSVQFSPDLARLKYLNNKVFNVTAGLERDIDFTYDEIARVADFAFDPTNAYTGATFGAGNARFDVRTRVPLSRLTVTLLDTGATPPVLVRSDDTLTISYDGPANGATGTAAALVVAINTSPLFSTAILAEVHDHMAGDGSPAADSQLLGRLATSPLDGFAARVFDVAYGTKFTDESVSSWLRTDVQKGDILRIKRSPQFGAPLEFPLALVRPDALYLYDEIVPSTVDQRLDYVIVRSPEDDFVGDEGYGGNYAYNTYSAVIDGAARTATLSTDIFDTLMPFHIGSAIRLSGAFNVGEWRVGSVIDDYTVTLEGAPLFDESSVVANVQSFGHSMLTDGVLVADPLSYTGEFTSPSSTFAADAVGGVISTYQSERIRHYEILAVISSTAVVLARGSEDFFLPDMGIRHLYRSSRFGAYQPALGSNIGLIMEGSIALNARRLLDDGAVIEGRDFTLDVDTGTITPRSVWRSSFSLRVSYRYRQIVANPLVLAALTAGSFLQGPVRYSDAALIGLGVPLSARLTVSGTANQENDGNYYVTARFDPSALTFDTAYLPTLPEVNNGALLCTLYSTGAADVVNTTTSITEVGMWAVDALVDRYHLYFTYGYLIKRAAASSEAYRALIRGLFQLFMLGPTIERFEAAINTVASLPVVRDDGEILLRYDNGAYQMGTDGVLTGVSRHFTSVTASFVPEDVSSKIYITDGFNGGRLFDILSVLNATTVLLVEEPVNDVTVGWELTRTAQQTVTTSRAAYALPRTIGIKAKYTDTVNWGVLSLRAFEVISSAFRVTDYVESPKWWETARIPQVLAPDLEGARRQATPELFENRYDPADDGRYGDPGFRYGASDDGVVPAYTVPGSDTDGVFTGDPLYPVRNTENFFETGTPIFTPDHVGGYLVASVPFPAKDVQYRVTEILSPVRVRIESFYPLPAGGVGPTAWELRVGALPVRHKAAYVILDQYLKYHLFSVTFDASLLTLLDTNLVGDLNQYVFQAKPTYTYLVLSPFTVFDDVIGQSDELSLSNTYSLGGGGGETAQSNDNVLRYDGSWAYGSWFRALENADTFVAPAATVDDLLGAPTLGYTNRVAHYLVDPTTLLDTAGDPLNPDGFLALTLASGTGAALAAAGADGSAVLTVPDAPFEAWQALYYVRILAPAANAGIYRIGKVLSDTTVALYAPAATLEDPVDWELVQQGSWGFEGRVAANSVGETFITDLTGAYDFTAYTDPSWVRRVVTSTNFQRAWRVDEAVSPAVARLAERTTLVTGITVNVDDDDVELLLGYFTGDMCTRDREFVNLATSKQQVYYIRITSGTNAGTVAQLSKYVSPTHALVGDALFATEAGVTADIFVVQHYADVVTEGGPYEHLRQNYYVDNTATTGAQLVLPVTQSAGVASYAAYGVMVPDDADSGPAFAPEQGDTYFSYGGVSPFMRYARPRTSRDMDQAEDPVQVVRTNLA